MANIIEIRDFSDPQLDVYARLTEAQLLNRHCLSDGLFIAESPLVIGRALDAGYEPVSLLMERKHIEGQAKEIIARCGNVPVYTAEFDVKSGERMINVDLYINRTNGFGPVHLSDRAQPYVSPKWWRSKGDEWSYEYWLKEEGLLSAPVVKNLPIKNK